MQKGTFLTKMLFFCVFGVTADFDPNRTFEKAGATTIFSTFFKKIPVFTQQTVQISRKKMIF